MKRLLMLFFVMYTLQLLSQEIPVKEIKSEVNEVTVFFENAQITRKKTIDLVPGTALLKFVNLSPFIEAKSIQVKANGEVTVLSVNHQQNYLDKLEKSAEFISLENKLQEIDRKITLENTYLSILKEELAFLQENRAIGGKNQELNVANLKETALFYSTKLTALKLKEIELNKSLTDLFNQKKAIENQLKTISSKKEWGAGEILVKINTKKNTKVQFELSYVVQNAGWFPSYDIRVKNINEPVEVIYKATVKQDTKEDWNTIKLKLSSANPTISGVAPELKPYFLNYNSVPPTYGKSINFVRGKVFDESGPLPGVSVIVKGTTIKTTTNMEGNYTITVPNNANQLEFSFVGMETQTHTINSEILNVKLNDASLTLDQVVITSYETRKNLDKALQGKVAGTEVKMRGSNSIGIDMRKVENQTTVNFDIKTPYTIKSDNKSYTVDMDVYQLPAYYQYYSIPKIDNTAFLMAFITDWEKYDLLEGEANLFFEDSYVGKSILDVRYATDTLQISLGSDKNISIKREKIKDYTTKKLIGSKKEESRAWMTTVKNNKNQKINLMILDQIPVATLEEIEIKDLKYSGAKHTLETGEIKWEFTLEPHAKKDVELRYTVKYPKYQNLILD